MASGRNNGFGAIEHRESSQGQKATRTNNIRIKYLKGFRQPTSDRPSSSRLLLGHQFSTRPFGLVSCGLAKERITPPHTSRIKAVVCSAHSLGPQPSAEKSLLSPPPAKALPLRPTPKPSFLLLEVVQPSKSFLLRPRWSKLMASARLLTRPLASLHSLMMGVTLVSLTTPVLLSSCCRRWQPPACKHPNKRPSLDDSPPN